MLEFLDAVLDTSDLPSPPGVALRILEIFEDPEFTLEALANVIGADPALTVKIIDYCNSPLLGRPQKTTSLHQAVVILGMRAVKMIALSFSLVSTKPIDESSFSYSNFWNQSLATAIASKTIYQKKTGNGEDAFLVGLMLNIGQIALANKCPEQFNSLLKQSFEQNTFQQNIAIAELERQKWSIDHYQIGGKLLKQWNFPDKIVEAVEGYRADENNPSELVQTLNMAEQLATMLFYEHYSVQDVKRVQAQAGQLLGVDNTEFDSLFEEFVSEWSEYAKLLKFECTEIKCLAELEERAKKDITKMMLGIHQENSQIQKENSRLKSKVLFDELTGLKNRRAYDSEVEVELQRAIRMEIPFALLMLDIDFFKKVNDEYGHDGGDAVLVEIAKSLKQNIRPYDSAYRFGGEEFLLMLCNCDEAVAKMVAERVRSAVEAMTISHLQHEIRVTASIGVACAAPKNMCTLPVLFKMADELLYRAKNSGRNRCFTRSTNDIPVPMIDTPAPIMPTTPTQ